MWKRDRADYYGMYRLSCVEREVFQLTCGVVLWVYVDLSG
ncbi:hypothetical protein EVA_11453 [gut metagenome]|uniref:Uncharacterized protein n=1 Tax=gut metagenome TaxID=749906 RepID=J9CK16_9ZZZZ